MPRYFFHVVDNDHRIIDDEGTELPDLHAARKEAVCASAEMLRDGGAATLWSGKPWNLWVTDHAGGAGKRLFTLQFSATNG
jgi:hypothetical protein